MLDFHNTEIKKLIIHSIGNKMRNENIIISNKVQKLSKKLEGTLLKYFLKAFKGEGLYKFHHETDLKLNEIYTFAKNIFNNSGNFRDQSINIAKHLYDVSNHPKVKSGELYIVHFVNCIVHNKHVEAIGLFKNENRDTYLKVLKEEDALKIHYERGISINKLDKGCIVFNIEEDDGYWISIVDNTNSKNKEALYWKEQFMNVKPLKNDSYKTSLYMGIFDDFCKNEIKDKKDKIFIRNKGLKYFDENDKFNDESFKSEVFTPKERELYENYLKKTDYNIAKLSFEISKPLVKQLKRRFKNEILLDDEVIIRVNDHDINLIEKGYDSERSMNYYKIYFNNEK
jgi:hypothetical protein